MKLPPASQNASNIARLTSFDAPNFQSSPKRHRSEAQLRNPQTGLAEKPVTHHALTAGVASTSVAKDRPSPTGWHEVMTASSNRVAHQPLNDPAGEVLAGEAAAGGRNIALDDDGPFDDLHTVGFQKALRRRIGRRTLAIEQTQCREQQRSRADRSNQLAVRIQPEVLQIGRVLNLDASTLATREQHRIRCSRFADVAVGRDRETGHRPMKSGLSEDTHAPAGNMDPVQKIPHQDQIKVGKVVECDDDDSQRVVGAVRRVRHRFSLPVLRYSRR
jgi:hypothetical protein